MFETSPSRARGPTIGEIPVILIEICLPRPVNSLGREDEVYLSDERISLFCLNAYFIQNIFNNKHIYRLFHLLPSVYNIATDDLSNSDITASVH